MVIDLDDFGCSHVISDMCQSHDCRDALDKLHYANGNFKVTLFTIPGEVTAELLKWCKANNSWIELAVHGFYHTSNYECEKLTYDEFDEQMDFFSSIVEEYFVKGFKAPGWQISDDAYRWLEDNGWWVSDQEYNSHRRPANLPAYVNNNGSFRNNANESVPSWHGHTWNCVGNGIYERYEEVEAIVKAAEDFKFVSEVV